jgi:endonuclease G, mitochondrial
MMTSNDESKAREAAFVAAARTKGRAYLRLPNVTSVGVGYRVKDGVRTKDLTIQFTVERKLAPESLVLEQLPALPESILADNGEALPVDVIQRTYKPSYTIVDEPALEATLAEDERQVRRSRRDPIVPGISISHVDGTAGTIGALVYDASNGTPYVLSNWHVLHGPTGQIGDRIVQPGPYDDGAIDPNMMGRLVRSHLGLAGDCAICSIVGRRAEGEILELGVTPLRIAEVSIDDKVVKSGRTTGVTRGIVTRTGVTANINYGGNVGVQQVGGFEIGVNPERPPANMEISMGGDSGSLWMIDEANTHRDVSVGLHFAGETDPNPAAEHAVACDIGAVLRKLQVSLRNPAGSDAAGAGPAPRRRRRRS